MHLLMVETYMLGLKVVTGHIVLGEGSDCVSVDEIYDEGLRRAPGLEEPG